MSVSLVCISLFYGTHECHELTWNNPVDITILDSLIELILLDIEWSKIVPLELDGILKSLETLQHRALVQAVALACISVRFEKTMIWTEHIPSFFCCALQNYYHKGTHKKCSINHLVSLVWGAIVEDSVVWIVLVAKKPSKFARVPVNHCKIEWTEVFIEREVCQVIINIEEERVLVVLRWLCTRYPIQFI